MIALFNALVTRNGLTVVWRFGGAVGRDARGARAGRGLRASSRRRSFAWRGCTPRRVDPDDLLRACRRLSFPSALTAALATRHGAGAGARRAAAGGRAAVPRRGSPRRGWRWCGRWRRARWTARWTWRRRSRCAATGTARRVARPAAAVVAPRPRVPRVGDRRCSSLAVRRARRRAVRRLPAHRRRRVDGGVSLMARRWSSSSLAAVRGPAGDRMTVLALDRVTYTYAGERARRCATSR